MTINDRSITRRYFLIVITAVFLLSGLFVNKMSYADEPADTAESFIRKMAETAIVRLTEQDISRDERKTRMREMMDEYFFIPGIAQLVMGKYWRQASPEERTEFVSLFEDLMVETYVDRFSAYNGETLNIVNSDVRSEKDIIVMSTMNRPEELDPLDIAWRLRARGQEYKIIDIKVDDYWMVQTRRGEYASSIKNNGGDIAKFLADLRERVTIAASGA